MGFVWALWPQQYYLGFGLEARAKSTCIGHEDVRRCPRTVFRRADTESDFVANYAEIRPKLSAMIDLLTKNKNSFMLEIGRAHV